VPCCSKPGPAYKQRVDLVFSSTPSTAATAPLAAEPDAGAVTKLLYYAQMNNDKLPQIARELERRIGTELAKKRFAFAVVGAFALNELLRSCHRDLRLFYTSVAATIRALLSCLPSRDIQLVGVDLFVTFAGLPSRVTPTPGDADAFVRDFVRLAEDASPGDVGHLARLAGLRGVRAYLPLLDEQPSRLNEDAPRLLPSIFANMRFSAPPVPYPRTPLAPKDDDSDDDKAGSHEKRAGATAAAGAKHAADDADDADPADADNDDDDDAAPSVRSLAKQCLRELALRTSTTNVKGLVEAALAFTDAQGLWTAEGGAEFTRELFLSICGTLKPQDYQTALDALVAKVAAVNELPHKVRVVDTLRTSLRGGMLTIHQLVRTLLQQLVDSLKLAFASKDAALHASHGELHRSLLAAIAELGNVVEQTKRWDLLNGIVRQLKALPGIFSKQPQCAAANALLARAFASVAANLKPLTASDASQLSTSYDALLAVAAAPASGDERAACALAVLDALRALVVVAPPRTDDDDDKSGLRFVNSTGAAAAGAMAASSASAEVSEADPKKRVAGDRRTRRGTGGPRDLAVGGLSAAPYVERHGRILTALDTMLFAGDGETAALCALVSAGGNLLLTALGKYGVGEALRTLPFIFSLQQRAVDMPDAEGEKTKKKAKKAAAATSVTAAAGCAVDASCDASAVHVLVGAYMAALAEQLDNDELRATVTHTLSQRTKTKQRSDFVTVSGGALVLGAAPPASKKASAAKRITTTFERTGVVAVLLRDKVREAFDQLAARLSVEWERLGVTASVTVPTSTAVSRLNSVAPSRRDKAFVSTNETIAPPAVDARASSATRSYPHNAPVDSVPPAQVLADASIDVGSFLAVLRGDLMLDDDYVGSENGDEHSGGGSGGGEDDDDGMQLSDSEPRSEISVDDDDNNNNNRSGKRKSKGSKGKNGAIADTSTKGGKKTQLLLQSSSATGLASAKPGSDQWREQVAKLRERSFDEVAAVSAMAYERSLRETAVAAFNFDAESAPTFADDDMADPVPASAQHSWHIATTLPILLNKLDTGRLQSGGSDHVPHLRDEFAVGALAH
jgi:hypothetical protein